MVVQQSGHYVVVDGFHRVAAAQQLGLAAVRVEIMAPAEDTDLVQLAFNLNRHHGRPLTLPDRRAHALRLLKRDPARSSRNVA